MNGMLKSVLLLTALFLCAIAVGLPAADSHLQEHDSWIVKWKGTDRPPADFLQESRILSADKKLQVTEVMPKDSAGLRAWLDRWENHSAVEYIQPNQQVIALAVPNDPLFARQTYLKQIGLDKAWDTTTANPEVVIASVDTGVDLDHPDLQANLVEGVNLIDPDLPPEDDNGHGTNVAGVLAAAGNNQTGVAGVLWNTKIMPIKALEADGSGEEIDLGRGIRHAVDHGARIVVLSLGLYKYSPFMADVVQYAEEQGVLLVAASGNDGKSVKFPAAYPTVLAVGAVNEKNALDFTMNYSPNYGPELDVVAPWSVYTTAMGGGYAVNEGTSMAAPQAAGVAALLWASKPELQAYQIRSMLRGTAQDIHLPGWDDRTGYGLIRADLALASEVDTDIYENNNRRSEAKRLPFKSDIYAALTSKEDADWFELRPQFRGEVRLRIEAMRPEQAAAAMQAVAYVGVEDTEGRLYTELTEGWVIPVERPGPIQLKLEAAPDAESLPGEYRIYAEFVMAPDRYEPNDVPFEGFTLEAKSQSVRGNLQDSTDKDWFVVHFDKPGTLQLKCSPGTYRMDPVLEIRQDRGNPIIIDIQSEGNPEYSLPNMEVAPGTYYIGISNATENPAYRFTGEYELEMSFSLKLKDPYEPNNQVFAATELALNEPVQGVFDKNGDEDWFKFAVQEDSYVRIHLRDIPGNRIMSLTLLDGDQKQLAININQLNHDRLVMNRILSPGTYFVRLSTNQRFEHQYYRMNISAEPVVAGFRDVAGHWAEQSIIELKEKDIISGYDDFNFRPDQEITRAEAVFLLVKTLNLPGDHDSSADMRFSDVLSEHWAARAIETAAEEKIVSGYPDGTFRPNEPLNRVEMVLLFAQAFRIEGRSGTRPPFGDIPAAHWAAGAIRQMKADGLITGYEDGLFKPKQHASRAEFVSLLSRVFN